METFSQLFTEVMLMLFISDSDSLSVWQCLSVLQKPGEN